MPVMRLDRSLIPGLGAAASVVAAVACAFFVTAAVIASHRWPQVVPANTARALIVAGDSRRARAIVAAAPARGPRVRARDRLPVTPRLVARRPIILARATPGSRPRRVLSVAPPVLAAAVGAREPSTPRPVAGPAVEPTVTSGLALPVQQSTSSVGGVLHGVTNGLASSVAPISPQVASTVQGLGSGVSGAVIGLGKSLAQVLGGTGSSQ